MISFNELDVRVPFLKRRAVRSWLTRVVEELGYGVGDINYIFCSDSALLKINKKYLNHDTLTDVITFDYSEQDFLSGDFKVLKGMVNFERVLSGDIYISIDRVKENSKLFHVKQSDELNRVLVHGILHLAGYKDKSPKDEKLMRKMEERMMGIFY